MNKIKFGLLALLFVFSVFSSIFIANNNVYAGQKCIAHPDHPEWDCK